MRSFEVNRTVSHGELPLSRIFMGLEDSEVIQSLFGGKDRATETLRNLRVKLDNSAEYMYVNDADGSIIVSGEYLRSASEKLLYLDIIHELVHVKWFRDQVEDVHSGVEGCVGILKDHLHFLAHHLELSLRARLELSSFEFYAPRGRRNQIHYESCYSGLSASALSSKS
mgnify:CR=1 FL=1